ncbi:MAG: choice-of-anchor D domain-containing protein [Alphaproteobacteria bacterium]|nr:choice-of-anchor D domain-containing protein [Alphaproteobacteria bacterium]
MRPTAMLTALVLTAGLGLGCTEYDLNRPDKDDDPVVLDSDPQPDEPAPDIEVSPSSIDFGSLLRDCTSDPEVITVRNVGEGTLEISSIELQGNGTSAFTLSAVPRNLEPGEEMTFDVSFTPNAWTRFTLDAVVFSNDPDEPEAGAELTGMGAEDQIFEESFTQQFNEAVDVLWVVDNSGSMSSALAQVRSNFQSFIGQFVHLGLDYQIAVVTTDMDNPLQSGQLVAPIITTDDPDPEQSFLDAVDLGSNGSGSEKGFLAAQTALSEPLLSTTNVGLLREGAAVAVIVVSDEDDDSSIQPANFANWFNGLTNDPEMATFSAICGDPGLTGCLDPFGTGVTATPGNLYIDAVDRTGGIWQSICTNAFDDALQHLSITAAGMDYVFPLSQEPSSIATLLVYVDGVESPYSLNDGWTYVGPSDADTPNSVVFHGAAIPGPGAIITVSYPVSGECI